MLPLEKYNQLKYQQKRIAKDFNLNLVSLDQGKRRTIDHKLKTVTRELREVEQLINARTKDINL